MNGPGRVSSDLAALPAGTAGSPSGRVSALIRTGWTLGSSCLVAALFAPWIALAGWPARRVLLAIVLLDIPLQIDQNFAYLDDAAALGAVGGFNVSVTTLGLAGLYATWLIDRLVHRNRAAGVPGGLVLPLAPYVCVAALTLIVARDIGLYSRWLFLMVQMILVYVYLVGTVRTPRDVRFVVMCLVSGLVLESVIILGLGVAGEGFEIAGLRGRIDAHTDEFADAARFGGTVGSPITAAAYLEMLLAPALAILATNMGRSHKMLAALGLCLGSAALIGTLSRGGWLAALLSFTIVCLLLWRGRRLSAAVPVVLVVVLSATALFFHEAIANRLAGDDRGSARSRVPLMMMALDIIGDNPALGVGANNYTEAIERRMPMFGNEWLFTVHNQYLLVWAETGVAGLATYLWFLLVTLRRGWHCWQRTDPLLSPLALGFTAALMGQMLHMQVDIFGTRPQVQLLFVVAALIGVMSWMDPPRRLPARFNVTAQA